MAAVFLLGCCCFMSPCGGVALIRLRLYGFRHHTDHTRLLGACRRLMKTAKLDSKTGEAVYFGPGWHGASGEIPANLSELPREIQELRPNYVVVRADEVFIQCGGGFVHYGFVAFAQGADRQVFGESDSERAERLTDGLWVFSE